MARGDQVVVDVLVFRANMASDTGLGACQGRLEFDIAQLLLVGRLERFPRLQVMLRAPLGCRSVATFSTDAVDQQCHGQLLLG